MILTTAWKSIPLVAAYEWIGIKAPLAIKRILLQLSAWASKIIIDCTEFKEIFNVTRTIPIETLTL